MMNSTKMRALEHYKISPTTGFAQEYPLTKLPNEDPRWMNVINNMWDLYKSKQIREKIHELPDFDLTEVTTPEQFALAHVRLSMLASTYVWQNGSNGAASMLPKVIAVPLCYVSRKLGLMPIVCYFNFLVNYIPLISDIAKLSNPMQQLKVIHEYSNNQSMKAFVLVGVFFEIKFAPFIPKIVRIAELSNHLKSHKNEVILNLNIIADGINNLREAFKLISEFIDPNHFYDEIRPFFSGWHLDTSPLPKGLIYEGVSQEPIPCNGGSNAQSGIIQSLDALLGIQHNEEKELFLLKNRRYMVKEHREFIEELERTSVLRDTVISEGDQLLTQAYNRLVEAVKEFRSQHIRIVAKYIVIPACNGSNDFKHLRSQGTGGITIDSLKFIRDKTANKVLKN